MKFIQGQNRTQINLFPISLDQSIDPDNEVRIIDLFVDSLSIKDYGFRTDFIEMVVRPIILTDLLKLFIYGYLNKVRSSRDLEKECPVHSKCPRSKDCRLIHRSDFADYYERNLINTREKEHLYRRRQAIVEHPYGTIKRSRVLGRGSAISLQRRVRQGQVPM